MPLSPPISVIKQRNFIFGNLQIMAIALVFTVVADGIAGDHGGQVLQVCELCVRLRVENGFPITEATSKH